MGTAADVLVGATGKVYGGPTGTALPTTTAVALNSAFVDLGYVSDDGVTQTINAATSDIKAWGGDTVRRVQTDHTLEYKFTFLETNPDVLTAFYTNYAAAVAQIKAGQGVRQAWVLDVIDGSSKIRISIPDGQVTDRGDVVYKQDEAVKYEITITCYPDSASVKAYLYVNDILVS